MSADHGAYDAFVAASPQGTVFANSWWLDAAAGPGNWHPNIVHDDGGAIVAAWPTVTRTARAGTLHVGAALTPALGPLLSAGSGKSRRSREAAQLARLVEELGPYAHLEARCAPAFDYWTPLHWLGFTQTTNYTWRIEDTSDLAATSAGLQTRVRTDIRKAGKSGVKIAPGGISDLQAMLAATFDRQGLGDAVPTPALVERIATAALDRDAGELLAARDEDGQLHAAGLFVWDTRSTWYVAGGADSALRSSGAMTALVWRAIEQASARHTAFDFEGSMLQHVESFVRAFGGEPTPYSIVRHTPSAAWRRRVALRRMARRLSRRR